MLPEGGQDTSHTTTRSSRRRWLKIALITVGAVILFAVLVVAIFFFVWQNKPEKTLLDAAKYAQSHPGTYHIKSDTFDLTATAKDKKYAAHGTLQGSNIDAIFDGKTIYIKSDDPFKLLATLGGESLSATAQKALPDIKDKWIKIDTDTAAVSLSMLKNIHCGLDSSAMLTDASSASRFTQTYLLHPFLNATSVSSTSSQSTYKVTVDDQRRQSFYAALTGDDANSDNSCSGTNSLLGGGMLKDITMNITVSQPDHVLRSMTITGNNQDTTVDASYGNVGVITAPTDAVNINQLVGTVLQLYLKSMLLK